MLRLASRPDGPALARAFVAGLLELWGFDADLIDDVKLMTSELAANAVLHVGQPFVLEVEEVAQGVRVAVRDRSPNLPVVRDHDAGATSGRGLQIVQALAAEWGALAT